MNHKINENTDSVLLLDTAGSIYELFGSQHNEDHGQYCEFIDRSFSKRDGHL